jgi:hypothetical protein
LLRSSRTEGIAKPESCSASIRQHTSAYVSIRQRIHTVAEIESHRGDCKARELQRQHTSAYVSIRQHTSAYVSIRQRIDWIAKPESCSAALLSGPDQGLMRQMLLKTAFKRAFERAFNRAFKRASKRALKRALKRQ